MQEQLVSFEVSKLAKSKGYSVPYWGKDKYYTSRGELVNVRKLSEFGMLESSYAPTQSILQRWLREVHYLDICINPHYKVFGGIAGYLVDVYDQGRSGCLFSNGMDSYELALEQGLQAALKLIK